MARYRFTKISKSKTTQDRPKSYPKYDTTIYQSVPERNDDIFVISTEGDRLDLLAQQFYGDSSLYWIIASANPQLKQNSLTPPVGTQLRIPTEIGPIISAFELLNEQN